jgi:DoxX-like family
MTYAIAIQPQKPAELWTGRALTTIAVLFLAFDAAVKLMRLPVAVEGTKQLGYPESIVLVLGIIQAIALILYLIPRTAIFGAIIWTGYLGGAVATHVRLGNPMFTHVLSPVYVAVLLWGGLFLRDRRLRQML